MHHRVRHTTRKPRTTRHDFPPLTVRPLASFAFAAGLGAPGANAVSPAATPTFWWPSCGDGNLFAFRDPTGGAASAAPAGTSPGTTKPFLAIAHSFITSKKSRGRSKRLATPTTHRIRLPKTRSHQQQQATTPTTHRLVSEQLTIRIHHRPPKKEHRYDIGPYDPAQIPPPSKKTRTKQHPHAKTGTRKSALSGRGV